MDTFSILILLGFGAYLVSKYSGSGSSDSNLQTSWSAGPVSSGFVSAMSAAIANAEGYNVPGSVAQRSNNPGNIKTGGSIATYATPSDGWTALNTQVQRMADGSSQYYAPGMTIGQVGDKYSGGDPNWASNVAAALGVSIDTTISDLVSMLGG